MKQRVRVIRSSRFAHKEKVKMKLTDLFARGRKRDQHADEIGPPAPAANDRADRSSMADLVRLLREHDDAPSGQRANVANAS